MASTGSDQVISNDPYNIPTSQLTQQQQFFSNFQPQPQQLVQQQQQQQPVRPISQQLFQQPIFQQQPPSRHFLPHQRSLPLPPPILQQLQARQQQQKLQQHYYQAANKLLFDDQRYYAGSNPLLEQPIGAYAYSQVPYSQQQSHYPSHRLHRSGLNLESTRGLNHSLQSQWLYGGGGRSSMAGDLLLSGQASAIGDAFDADQKIVNDFCLLYDESRQLFNGLR